MRRLKTGTEGLDELLTGGVPERRNVLISGTCGTGKTILAAQFLRQGVENDESGLMISFEQDEEKLIEDLLTIGIDVPALEKTGKFRLIGGPIGVVRRIQTKTKAKKEDILKEVERVVGELGTKRVVLDSINLFLMLFEDEAEKRESLAELTSLLAKKGCTSMLTCETEEGSKKISHYGFEEFVSDGVIVLYRIAFENMFERAIAVIKMRGIEHSKAIRAIKITKEGLKVYPEQEPYHK
ncbi:MAG: hypothetical protein MUP45_03845 [Candidatus Marinimicrobia bacterium]|nr:hypothetical protein [Candidatus Neomarinimicrobiota bacterium]